MSELNYLAALRDFRRARRQASLEEVLSRLRKRSPELMAFEDVRQKLHASATSKRRLEDIPLASIVGSVGRYADFTRDFLPRANSMADRWAKIEKAFTEGKSMDPIEVYKIGEAYFVQDGNHRVSVARAHKLTHIQAYVTELETIVSLSPETQPDELIVKAEYTEFLLRTRVDKLFPQADLSVTVPGRYRELEEQILIHRYQMVEAAGEDIPQDEAVINWVEDVYLPVINEIRQRRILRNFPGRTETDLYVWVARHRKRLERRLGWNISTEKAAEDLAEQFSPRAPQVVARVGERLYDAVTPDEFETGPRPGHWREEHQGGRRDEALFADLLVPISGDPSSWFALDQALLLAIAWKARLHGLHVVPSENEVESEATQLVKAAFLRRCREAGVPGEIGIGVGKVARVICERAHWVDLLILNLAHPPPSQPLAKVGSGFRTLIRRCSRPLLAVPGPPSQFKRLLLAYDGSPKAEEALYIATYLADRWKVELVVLSIVEPGQVSDGIINVARDYMDTFGVQAAYVETGGSVPETILETCAARKCDVIVMGGYGFNPVLEVVLGSAVDQVLREFTIPVLVCR